MRTLPDDWCRCTSDDCPDREECVRWLQREEGGPRVVMADLYPVYRDSGSCPAKIPVS